jgi:GNAT superfamily N-acetyltransferase
MDEKYLQDLYSWIVSKDPSYQNNVTPEAFKQKMTDPTYVSKMHGWISSLDPTFQRDMTVDKFTERVGLGKKKVDTALLGEDGSSVLSKTKPQPEVAESTAAKPMMPPPAAEESKAEDDGQGWLVNTVSAIDRGFYKNLIGSPIKGLGTLLEGANRKMFGGTGKDSITDALISFGDYFNNTIDELAPQDEDFKGSLTDQFSQAFGQVASLVLTGGASAVVKGATLTTGGTAAAGFAAPKAVTVGSAVRGIASQLASPVSVSAGLTMGQNEFDRAKEMGATDDQAFEAFYKNAAVGSILEKIPVMQFMKRFNTASAGGLVNYIRTKGVAGLTGGLEEMTTEVLQQIYANKTAQEIYNANQELFEGVGSSGGVGFGVGFLLNAMGANARLLRNQGRTEEAKVIEDQIKELETQAERGGPSSYTFNGIKIQPIEIDGNIQEPRKVIEDMIDNMSAADLAKANIEITNDPELRIKLQEKIVTSSIKEQAREANPNLTEEQLDEVTNLEKELRKLEGNTTQIGKDKAAAIRSQIKTIQENAIQEQSPEGVDVQEPAREGDTQEKITYGISEAFDIEEKILEAIPKEKGMFYHGSPNIEWTTSENIDVESNTRNAPSKYLFLAEKPETALAYSKERKGEVTEISKDSGVAVFKINKGAKVYKLTSKDVKGADTIDKLESVYDGIKEKGYDVIINTLDGNNRIILNNDIIEYRSTHKNQEKTKQDAIQKQAAGQVPVQSEAGVSGEVAQGVTQAKPESVTEEGVTKEKIKSLDRNDVIELAKLSGIESNWDMAGEGDWLSGKKGEDAYVQRMLPMWNRASQLGEINPDSEITYRAKDNYVEAVDENGVAVGMIQMDSDGGILHLAVAPEFRGKGLAENLYAELKKNNPNADLSKTKNRSIGFEKSLGAIGITEAYNKAKQEGTNPELVSAVEQLLKPEAVSPTVGLLPEEFYQIDENDLGDADRIPEAEVIEEIGQELTEADLPGYDRMMGEIEGVIKKSENRGVPFNKIMENVMEYMKGSKAYENATDVQREALVRDIRSRFKKREKRAPSAKKILGQEKTMVTVDDYKMMINQIKMEARAAREAKGDLNTKRKMLADAIRKMASTGKIAANRVAALVNRIGKVNLDSNESVERLIDYAGKLFADAEYANKLSAANTTRSQIRKLSKNKDKFANLRDLGSKFAEIDPSMVEDIDQYNRVASLIKESIKGSTTRGADVKFANMVREADAAEYINKTMEEQRKKLFDLKVAEVQELLGVDASELTYDQLMQMLESDKPLTKDNEKLVRSAINKAFDIYSSLIKSSVKTGKDLFTGEDVQYTANQKKVVNEFMDMDLNILKPKQALEAVDALMNFFQNQSIAKMESVVAKYKGEAEMRAVEKKGIKAKPISKYWSKGLGRLLLEQTANLNIVFERMFGGFTKGGMVEDAMGVSQIESGKAKAQAESNLTVEQYVKELYKTKPNGQDFNTAFNEVERNMGASMMRNIIGTEAEMKEEFDRRKKLIKESIEVLSEGNEQEVEKGKIYEQVYNKILKDSKTIDEVVSKVDKTNQKAIEFWQGKWSGIYDKLYDVALGVYNKVLDKDISFTPDRFSKLSSDFGEIDLTAEDMGFLVNSGNAPLYKKETGVLMAATRPKSLPKNPNTGRVNRYLDFSFDKNNANSYYDALVDINTAAPIRQVQSALNSDSFARMLKGTGDDKLLRNRIDLYVKNIRNKNPFSNDEFSKAVKGLNRLSAIGVGQALGGVFQPIKQVIPIAMNTLINAGGLDINSAFNTAKRSFINKSGYAIANRGIESQAQIESLNKMIDQAANSKPEKVFRAIEKANNWWLKNLLVRFDVAIARASWMTYYEQSLKKQGIDPSGIDYNTHEINEKAADYAQRQVDRQQNVSDSDLAGALLSSKDSSKQLFVKVLMPFASFRMNQSARLGSDLATLTDKTSTVEDKKIAARSLAGFAAEMVTFRALSAGSALLIAEVVKEIMGREDDEEKNQKKIDAILKGQLTSTVADVFSPAPLLDKAIQMGAAAALDSTQDALDIDEEDRLEIYSGNKQDLFQSLGLLGIAGSRANQLWEMTKLSMGAPYEDDFGRKKYLSEQDREAIGTLVPMAIVSNIGLVPSEVNSIIRSSLADAKRNASTVEGGKSREDVRLEERSDELSTERKEAREQAKAEKIKALEALRNDEIESDKIQVINDMIEELSADDKDKGKSEKKKDKIEKDEKMKELLQGYDNKSDMKRYDPDLYEENFGENSEYYLENKAEMEVEKELNKKLQEIEDDERGYTPAQKRTKKYKDRLKSFKSRYRRESESSN